MPDHLDDAALDAIEARAKAATEGPWISSHNMTDGTFDVSVLYSNGIGVVIADCRKREHDSAFIAHARADVPALIAALRAEREEAEGARRCYRALSDLRWELAAERDAAIAEVERLREVLDTTVARADDMHESMVRQRDAAIARAEAAEAAIAAVRALHVLRTTIAEEFCVECILDWPCATIRALDTGATT